jgi:Domain of unknown function (DU1801)
MPFTNFNPPLTNKNLQDFFEFQCENQHKAIFMQNWIADNFPDLNTKLAYHVPFYYLAGTKAFYYGEKIFYLHYFEIDGELNLEISFVRGAEMQDRYGLFQNKNKQTKSIIIESIEEDFMYKIKSYIEQAINLV